MVEVDNSNGADPTPRTYNVVGDEEAGGDLNAFTVRSVRHVNFTPNDNEDATNGDILDNCEVSNTEPLHSEQNEVSITEGTPDVIVETNAQTEIVEVNNMHENTPIFEVLETTGDQSPKGRSVHGSVDHFEENRTTSKEDSSIRSETSLSKDSCTISNEELPTICEMSSRTQNIIRYDGIIKNIDGLMTKTDDNINVFEDSAHTTDIENEKVNSHSTPETNTMLLTCVTFNHDFTSDENNTTVNSTNSSNYSEDFEIKIRNSIQPLDVEENNRNCTFGENNTDSVLNTFIVSKGNNEISSASKPCINNQLENRRTLLPDPKRSVAAQTVEPEYLTDINSRTKLPKLGNRNSKPNTMPRLPRKAVDQRPITANSSKQIIQPLVDKRTTLRNIVATPPSLEKSKTSTNMLGRRTSRLVKSRVSTSLDKPRTKSRGSSSLDKQSTQSRVAISADKPKKVCNIVRNYVQLIVKDAAEE